MNENNSNAGTGVRYYLNLKTGAITLESAEKYDNDLKANNTEVVPMKAMPNGKCRRCFGRVILGREWNPETKKAGIQPIMCPKCTPKYVDYACMETRQRKIFRKSVEGQTIDLTQTAPSIPTASTVTVGA